MEGDPAGGGDGGQLRGTMLRHSSRSPGLLLLLHLATAFLFLPTPHCACTPPERDSLLSFLSNISTTPPLTSWSTHQNSDCCLWEGISCDPNASVTRLWLPGRGLKGTISPSLVSLPRLAQLNLSHNRLSGVLPRGLLWSDHILLLDVSFNALSGELPPPPPRAAAYRRPIRSLNVSSNRFVGEFPAGLVVGWPAPDLTAVNASNNSFSGAIPPSICTASPRLATLDLSLNDFDGTLPPGALGNCSELQVFSAGSNYLSGPLPVDLFGAVRLRRLSLHNNQLTGSLPHIIPTLTHLLLLDLGGNNLTGELPDALGKLPNLTDLLLNDNQFNGAFPLSLTNCTNLRSLNLRGNNLTGDISAVDFSRLTQLRTLDLGNNYLDGEIPPSIYSCTSLVALRLSHNRLRGSINPQLRRLRALSYLSLSSNKLTGVRGALQVLTSCKNLTVLLLAWNFQGEPMPPDDDDDDAAQPQYRTGAFTRVRVLSLWGCGLTGTIPAWMSGLGSLEVLDLSGNQLTGTVPPWLGSLPRLFYLDLSDNHLSGGLPAEITAMKALLSDKAAVREDQASLELPVFRGPTLNASGRLLYNRLSSLPPTINLSKNNLGGSIPPGMGLLKRLRILHLDRNNFSGQIPVQLSHLSNLAILDLSRNHLSGPIPHVLGGLHFLSSFSVAFNNLSGPIPSGGQFDTFPNSSFEGNAGLCGEAVRRPCTTDASQRPLAARRKKLLVGLLLLIVFGVAALSVFLVLFVVSRHGISKNFGHGGDSMDLEATSSTLHRAAVAAGGDSQVVMLFPVGEGRDVKELTISDVTGATNNFHQDNIVGCGAYGTVYKANLPDGTKLAIKSLAGDMCLMEREFAAEVEALSGAQHENLVSLKGYYVHGNFRLLIYSYMDNGSLDYWLHEKDGGGSTLDWPLRLRIARGVSQGLSYIHHICEPHIVHRDIKSSNILLDLEFEAHLADFGLSRLILPQHTHVTTDLVGTLGYIPPEYGQTWVATLRGDIYSFGVVLLELLTGRRPVDFLVRPRQSSELVDWVQQMRCQGRHEQVFDPSLRGKGFEQQMTQMLDIACNCVSHHPSNRPTIQQVVTRLDDIVR